MTIGKSADSIQYLEKEIKVKEGKKIATGLVMETSKPFDFEKDYIRCLSIYRLISNIINTRKYSYLLDLKNQPFTIWHFHAIDLEEFLYNDNGGMIRSSWSV